MFIHQNKTLYKSWLTINDKVLIKDRLLEVPKPYLSALHNISDITTCATRLVRRATTNEYNAE